MTIDLTGYHECSSLILPSRTFYPTKIPHQHHQLKNFISTVDKNVIYFASSFEVYALHKETHKKELIASLSWKPQCLGAGYGWICVGGGDQGRCAFIDVREYPPFSNSSRLGQRHGEVDSLLPLDLDPESRLPAHDFLHRGVHTSAVSGRRRPKIQLLEIGSLIVNSITVHRLIGKREGEQDEIIALLTNNDKYVRIFSLTLSCVLDSIEFPTPMNHATISPDGELMVAVGDEPRAFFYRRKRLTGLDAGLERAFPRYRWLKIAAPRLSSAVPHDACFSTAFSPSGHVCAVAAQSGSITVFDTRLVVDDLETDEAVIGILSSSRPYHDEDFRGAVRSMSFGPEPWDLFAWAEDHGRVCVTDLRNAFRSRQTIELETNASDVERAQISDLEEDYSTAEQRIHATFEQRNREALEAQDQLAAANHPRDYLELAMERRRWQNEARASSHQTEREPSPYTLTESERQILDSLRLARQGDTRDLSSTQQPFSVHYHPSSNTISPTRPTDPNDSIGSLSSAPPANRTHSIHEYMRERYLNHPPDRNRPSERSYQPRRRTSVVISNNNSSSPSSSSHPSSLLAPVGTTPSTLSASPSRISSSNPVNAAAAPTTTTSSPPPDPWQTISEAMSSTGSLQTATRLRRERELGTAETVRERPIAAQEAFDRRGLPQQQAERMESIRAIRLRQLQESTSEVAADEYELDMLMRGRLRRAGGGLGVMGLGWSGDGRSLCVGTEEGILEYTVNLQERKTFPGLSFR